jgi:hypothetical protein
MNKKRGLALSLVCAGLACASASPALGAAERVSASDGGYILRTMPLRHESRDAEARAPVEALWKQLLEQLRQVPGITLLPAGAPAPPGDQRQEYQLTLASLPTTRLNSNFESYTSLYDPNRRGTYMSVPQRNGVRWPIEIRVERDGRDTTRNTLNTITFLVKEGGPRPPNCQQEIRSESLASGSGCWSSPELAEKIADNLRLERLPPDDGMYRKLVNRIADNSINERQRSLALHSLATARREGRFVAFDQQALAAISSFAGSASSPMRGLIWTTLQGVSPPEFVPSRL